MVHNFVKKANLRLLQMELLAADFAVVGITYHEDGERLEVHLADGEKKDPAQVVDAHVFKEDLHPDWQVEWAKCATDTQRVALLGKHQGFIELTDEELSTGILG